MEKIEKKKIPCGQNEKGEKISRREFLKRGLLGAGAGTLYLVEKKYGWLGRVFEEKSEMGNQKVFSETINLSAKEVIEDDIKPAEKILGPLDKLPVRLNRESAEGVEEYWYRQYKTDNPKLVKSLENAYIAMQPYVPELKRIFAEEQVPEKYLWLAIPESHWNLEARSHAAAVGPYQFTKSTAKKFGLEVNEKIDERCVIHSKVLEHAPSV